jgi:enamine deaminase RidA (YjgF/YER057c/UK114 family)
VVAGELTHVGIVGADVTAEEAYAAARTATLNALAAVRSIAGSLDAVTRIVKVTGFVASAVEFTGQPQVVNGASELLGEIFGDVGTHSRSAVGVAVLPLGAPVEIELMAEVA